VAAGNPMFVCCKFRGSLVALDAKTGKQIWKSYTIPDEAKLMGKTANGTEIWGPAGASVWSPPTVDAPKHTVYFGTGVNYTQPGTNTSDAVVALDLNTGEKLWAQQLAPGDVLALYSPRTQMRVGRAVQSFTAIGSVCDREPYLFQQTASLAPIRRDVAYFDAQAARIEPLLDKLSFIRSREHWGMAFRRGLVEVSEDDMEVIAEAMSVTAL